MSNRTNKKAPDNRGNNEEMELEMSLRSIWLGKRFLNRTFSPQEDDPIVDVDEIIEILDAKLNDSSTKRESNPPYL